MKQQNRKTYFAFLLVSCMVGTFSFCTLEAKAKKFNKQKIEKIETQQAQKEGDNDFFLPRCSQRIIFSVPYTIDYPGEYLVKYNFFYNAPQAAITVNANNVNIVFCEDALLTLGDGATGINIKASNVNILNGQFKALTPQATAIKIADGVQKWSIDECIFKNFSKTIISKNFSDGTMTKSCFLDCSEGLIQQEEGVAHRLIVRDIRSENTQLINSRASESYAVTLNGEVFDYTLEGAQLTSSSLYCFQCRSCNIDNIEVYYPSFASPLVPGVQCGGPRNGLLGLYNFANPIPEALQKGCKSCRISNVKIVMNASDPDVNFPVGIVALFCQNCEITQSQVTIDGGNERIDGLCILEAYCENCTISDCQVEGPSATGIFVCDPIDQCIFCNATKVIRCSARNCWLGINVLRCNSPIVDACNIQQNKTGLIISEGSSNAIVTNCNIAENELGLFFGPLSAANIFNGIFPPTFTPDEFCPEEIRTPKHAVVTHTTFNGNITPYIDQVGSLNFGVGNNLF